MRVYGRNPNRIALLDRLAKLRRQLFQYLWIIDLAQVYLYVFTSPGQRE